MVGSPRSTDGRAEKGVIGQVQPADQPHQGTTEAHPSSVRP
jgi:hypothetical protein